MGAYDGRPDSVGVKVGDVTGLGVRLSWQQAFPATSYAVYRGATAFFRPNETHLLVEGWTALFLIDPGAWGSAGVNRYHVVVPRNAWGCGPISDRVGEFDWSAVAGAR